MTGHTLEPVPAVGTTTLLAGGTVCVSGADGEIRPERVEGVFHRDVRVVSRLTVDVDGSRPTLLAATRTGASRSEQSFVVRTDDHGSPTAVLIRERRVQRAVIDRYVLHRYQGPGTPVEIALGVGTDLVPLTKGLEARPPIALDPTPDGVEAVRGGTGVRISIDGPVPTVRGDRLAWSVGPDTTPWTVTVTFEPVWDGHTGAAEAPPRRASLTVDGPDRWRRSVASAQDDLHGLRVPGRGGEDPSFVAAGAPWFMALFGRDSLLTAHAALIAGTDLALEVLESLAHYQGRSVDPRTLEEPGKILHELRTGAVEHFDVGAHAPYYGSVDATPLFVMVLADAWRFGAEDARVRALLPAMRAAVGWMLGHDDRRGDGYLTYEPDPDGLRNQGWKDSDDPMVHRDGRLAPAPIALSEVQGYQYRALLDAAALDRALADGRSAPVWEERAASLRAAFHRDFWRPEHGLVAMALDGDGAPLEVASSNMGHCLWTGIVDDGVAAAVADQLTGPALRSSWGIRTLASDEVAYNPLSYHLGSVWPHDTAIAAAGLARYGYRRRAYDLVDRLLRTCSMSAWRLPELLAGYSTSDVGHPVPYPVACSPQAWSAAAPIGLLRTSLGLEPDVPAGRLRIASAFPPGVRVGIDGIRLGRARLDLRVDGRHVALHRDVELDVEVVID